VIGDRGLAEGTLEYKHRRDADSQAVPVADIVEFINSRIKR
jgi:prolyl-tRNA synthetase